MRRAMTRRGFLHLLAGATAFGLAGVGYAFAIEPGLRLVVQRWRLSPPGWPRGFKLRIVALSDLHAGVPYMDEPRVRQVVARANALEPDVIVLLGDYAASHRFTWRPLTQDAVARAFSDLRAPLGVHAVLGNHDWWDDLDVQKRGAGPTLAHQAFAAHGMPILENDALRLEKDGRPFWLLGLGDQLAFPEGLRRKLKGPWRNSDTARIYYAGVDDIAGTVAKITDDAPAILLAHEPDIFPMVPDRVALTLSGHTHGGQVRLFGWAPVPNSLYGQKYVYGPVTEGARTLVTSGGLGCSLMPVRFGVPPEITVIELS